MYSKTLREELAQLFNEQELEGAPGPLPSLSSLEPRVERMFAGIERRTSSVLRKKSVRTIVITALGVIGTVASVKAILRKLDKKLADWKKITLGELVEKTPLPFFLLIAIWSLWIVNLLLLILGRKRKVTEWESLFEEEPVKELQQPELLPVPQQQTAQKAGDQEKVSFFRRIWEKIKKVYAWAVNKVRATWAKSRVGTIMLAAGLLTAVVLAIIVIKKARGAQLGSVGSLFQGVKEFAAVNPALKVALVVAILVALAGLGILIFTGDSSKPAGNVANEASKGEEAKQKNSTS